MNATRSRPRLYSRNQGAAMLGISRHTLNGVMIGMGIRTTVEAGRRGLMVSRDDLDRIAERLNTVIDWSVSEVA